MNESNWIGLNIALGLIIISRVDNLSPINSKLELSFYFIGPKKLGQI